MFLIHASVAIGNGPRSLELDPCALAFHSGFAIWHVPIAFLGCVDNRLADVLALAGDIALTQASQGEASIAQEEKAGEG